MDRKPSSASEKRYWMLSALVVCTIGIGAGIWMGDLLKSWYVGPETSFINQRFSLRKPKRIKLPGPTRPEHAEFILRDDNALVMTGMDDPVNERFADIAGNYYNATFCREFSYAGTGKRQPKIYLAIGDAGPTLSGRLEAHGLKPNFAYQIKLYGDFKYRRDFETIGCLGRWRLPGIGTNYTDDDYRSARDDVKAATEAYILFDFFVTDGNGNAVRDFALDSSLHVLWKDDQIPSSSRQMLQVTVDASNPAVYTRPKRPATEVSICPEFEEVRYQGQKNILLPPGQYHAFVVLTEESFHSTDRDGGFWATIAKVPVTFEIVRE